MAISESELYAAACEVIETAEETCAGELDTDGMDLSGASTPGALAQWLLLTLKDLGCENQELIRSAAAAAIAALVKNPIITAICLRLLDRVISSYCSAEAPQ